ncbi:ubiquitin-like modifier-activating enzyme ATG7 [Scheffersomyces coipomensis]|uniref:ubiquitin-like modifier-activating enzyme ATG7 n=1 Tax=Scheffersomyces coipomensis TaxID=1788519 RepID=UPI00315CC6AA
MLVDPVTHTTGPIKYTPVTSFVESSFFSKLAELKLNKFKLDDNTQPLKGFITSPQNLSRHDDVCRLKIDFEAFETFEEESKSEVTRNLAIDGEILNLNTLEAFKSINKSQLLEQWAKVIHDQIITTQSLSFQSINKFFILSFSDLKKYKFYYWIATPTLNSPWQIIDKGESLESNGITIDPSQFHKQLFFQIIDNTVQDVSNITLHETGSFVFVDTSLSPLQVPSIHLKNYLYLLAVKGFKQINLVIHRPRGIDSNLKLKLDDSFDIHAFPKFNGWERNNQGKLIPKMADLANLISPNRLAEQAVDLNLKLMKWRVAPTLDLDIMKTQKVLLLGSGTLGSYVSRALLAWGFNTITLVDNGRVSYSNPVRQPLFKFEDCFSDENKGEWKAVQAAKALKEIYPGVDSTGINLEVPMIGHPITDEEVQKGNFDKLSQLFDDHDIIFLLMDSRESRWLPTVLGQAKNKLVINAALGYDSYLVIRHGSSKQDAKDRLGCYYCNDVVAPTDSTTDRTLDQMCTVTRPGGALMASSLAVELLVSILQHPDHQLAANDSSSKFGSIPHQIRGYLNNFQQNKFFVPNYKHCSACSDYVVEAYLADGWEFIKRCLNDATYLEEVSGLTEVQKQAELASEALLEQMGFSGEEDDEDDEWLQ